MPPLNYSPYPGQDQNSPWMNLEDLIQQKMAGSNEQIAPPSASPIPEYVPDSPFGGMGSGGSSSSLSSNTIRPESLAMWNKLINKQSEGLNMEKQGLQALEKRKSDIENQPRDMNWIGLMALADAWGTDKSNFAGNYKQPQNAEERAKLMFELENQIQKSKQGFTDDEVKLMKSQLEAAIMKEQKAEAKTNKKSEALNKYGADVVKAYNGDTVVKKFAGAAEQAGQVVDLLNSNNPLADNTIPTFMARASGEVGNLSEADKKPFGGAQSLSARIKQATEQMNSGTLTPENREFVGRLAETMSKHAQEAQDKRARILAEQYGRANSNVSPQDVLGVIAPHLEYQPLQKGKTFQTSGDKAMGRPHFKEGDIREKNGKNYQRNADGTWSEM